MDIQLWLTVLLRAVGAGLATQGKTEQAALLNDAASAVRSGKNVDDIMRSVADKWEAEGEPSFDEIALARQAIQDRM
jgi:hypothetical protein